MNSNGTALVVVPIILLLFALLTAFLTARSAFSEPEPAAEFCAEELTQRVLTPEGKLEVSTHCVRREPYVLPGE